MGPCATRCAQRGAGSVELRGRVPEAELVELYARCRALVYTQEEDFGIAALEAQASGRPVIALARGGALETVRPLVGSARHGRARDGRLLRRRRLARRSQAPSRASRPPSRSSTPRLIRSHAERFSARSFRDEFLREVQATLGLDAGASGQ